MDKYIKYIPKTLLDDIVDNTVIPMVGAGFSKNANIPAGKKMSDWAELASVACEYLDSGYDFSNPIDALSVFEKEFSRVSLIEMLAKKLHIREITPGKTHDAFVKLLFNTICTTNFDSLIENTLVMNKMPHSIVFSEESLSVNTKHTTQLIKLHGDFHHPERMIITEDDYDTFLDKNQVLATYISNLFISNTLLLIGYSFDDPDIRQLWQIINYRLGQLKRQAYCLMVDASKLDILRFERRNVKVINIPGSKSEYPLILEKIFEEIKSYSDSVTKVISSNERAQEELLLPKDDNRLCFISASFQNIAKWKSIISPILEKHCYTMISIDDVIPAGGNWNWQKTVETLMRKAAVSFVDISDNNPNVMWELGVLDTLKQKTILVSEESGYIPFDIRERLFLIYDVNNVTDFRDKLDNVIKGIDKNSSIDISEPNRLFDKEEYTSAIISSFRLLETTLIDYFHCHNDCVFCHQPRMSTRETVHALYKDKVIDIDIDDFEEAVKTRNKVLHSMDNVSKETAHNLLSLNNKIIQQLKG